MTDPTIRERLREHEQALVAFGRFMVNPPADPMKVDYAEMGRLAALAINGIPAVRAVLRLIEGSDPAGPEPRVTGEGLTE